MPDPTGRLRRVRDLFDLAMDQPAAGRRAFVDAQGDWDEDVRAEVRELIDTADTPDGPVGTILADRELLLRHGLA